MTLLPLLEGTIRVPARRLIEAIAATFAMDYIRTIIAAHS